MSLWRAYIGTRVLETSHNYALADGPLINPPTERTSANDYYLHADDEFWRVVMADVDQKWGMRFRFEPVAVSEWIARVPGLFWKPGVRKFREFEKGIYEQIGPWKMQEPLAKSTRVMGGIGTLRLPPTEEGTRLVSLTYGLNVSAGIPALVSPEVWDKISAHGSAEGRLIQVCAGARWQPMSVGWAAQLDTGDLPRGYLVIRDPDAIDVLDQRAATLIHPFSVMEYREGDKSLFDFVFATADTGTDYRGRLEVFFADYAEAKERYGRYLLAGDMVHKIWDAAYNTPADLRRAEPGAKARLNLLEERVREHLLGGNTIDRLTEALGAIAQSTDDLQRLSKDALISPALWCRGGTIAEVASQLVEETLRQKKLEALIEVVAHQYPAIIRKEP